MKTSLIIPVAFLIIFAAGVMFGKEVVASWWSFLIGAIFALSARDIGEELLRRAARR